MTSSNSPGAGNQTGLRRLWLAIVAPILFACDSAPSVDRVVEEASPVDLQLAYEYDALDRLVSVRYSNGDIMRYSYDEAGNILSIEMDAAE